MTSVAAESGAVADASPATADRRLADTYADRHERLDRFVVMYAVPQRVFGRLRIELYSTVGYALLFAALAVAIFVPAVATGALTGELATDFLVRALVVSLVLGALNVAALVLGQSAAYNISGVHRALADDEQVASLIACDRRWYSPAASALVGGAFALAFLAVLYVLSGSIGGVALPPVTIWFGFVIALFLGQFTFSIAMIFFEFRAFTRCRFDLYTLRPIETQALQTTARGLRQLGVVSIVLFPLFNLVLLSILPGGSNLNVLVTIGFLLLSYVATAVGILFPLAFLGTIVKREKRLHLRPLEHELKSMVPRVPQMSDTEYEEFRRLETLRNTVADSPDSFLGVGSVARIVGAAGLSTVTVVATAAIQFYLERAL